MFSLVGVCRAVLQGACARCAPAAGPVSVRSLAFWWERSALHLSPTHHAVSRNITLKVYFTRWETEKQVHPHATGSSFSQCWHVSKMKKHWYLVLRLSMNGTIHHKTKTCRMPFDLKKYSDKMLNVSGCATRWGCLGLQSHYFLDGWPQILYWTGFTPGPRLRTSRDSAHGGGRLCGTSRQGLSGAGTQWPAGVYTPMYRLEQSRKGPRVSWGQ